MFGNLNLLYKSLKDLDFVFHKNSPVRCSCFKIIPGKLHVFVFQS